MMVGRCSGFWREGGRLGGGKGEGRSVPVYESPEGEVEGAPRIRRRGDGPRRRTKVIL